MKLLCHTCSAFITLGHEQKDTQKLFKKINKGDKEEYHNRDGKMSRKRK